MATSAIYTSDFEYELNQEIFINDFDPTTYWKCSSGIHFHSNINDVYAWLEFIDIPEELKVKPEINIKNEIDLDKIEQEINFDKIEEEIAIDKIEEEITIDKIEEDIAIDKIEDISFDKIDINENNKITEDLIPRKRVKTNKLEDTL